MEGKRAVSEVQAMALRAVKGRGQGNRERGGGGGRAIPVRDQI